ncbi:MAG: hypothetical protein PHO02_00485 [Candidatus Nanoarchaeia archaeon]|nr:hypothetical protein [Candidatus Nanoarchaeia archaeon]
MADLIPVRDRLTRLQKENYKSLPEKPYEKSVEQEIEELKQSDMIQPVSMAPKADIEIREVEDDNSAREEDLARQEEKELLMQIEHRVSEIESIKAEMMKKGNFMQRMYDIKKIENDILPLLFDAKGKCIMIPEALRQRILMAAPKAAILE